MKLPIWEGGQTFEGRPQSLGAMYYQMPLKKFLKKAAAPASSETPSSTASAPESKVTK